MSGLRPRRFSDKISLLVIATCAVAVVCVTVVLATYSQRDLRHATFEALQAQTDIAALNSDAPLVFGDRRTAREVLEAFRALPSVTSATLYDARGKVFARYVGSPSGHDEQVVRTTMVEDQGQHLGHLAVVYDLSGLHRQLWSTIVVASLTSLLALLLASLAAHWFSGLVTRRLARLTRTAERVSESGDYSLRANAPTSDDEIGVFAATFNQMLERIERQDAEVRAARSQAEAANRLKDEFLATLSHELRTPMTPILGWAQILRRIAGNNQQLGQAAEVIERNAIAQTRLIDDLLDMSRIVSGKIRLDIQPVRLEEVLAAALDAVRKAAQARAITLDIDLAPGLPVLRADPHRLQQVLWNLLSNAVKFTPTGGVVRVGATQRDGVLRIEVRDSGQGIAAEFLPHVFERFRQADSSVTRAHGGLGLGLAIVKQLVEAHGGTVTADSSGVGQGAVFTITLPLQEQASHVDTDRPPIARADTAPVASTALRDLRVLLVEDEADARHWMQVVLSQHGACVTAVESAGHALTHLYQEPTDVLVSDIGMPGMDGYALLDALRARPDAQEENLQAIAVTAFAREEDRERALRAGFQFHLGKPVDEHLLVATVQEAARAGRRERSGSARHP